MPISNSRGSYADCYAIFDKALDSNVGISVPCKDENHATFLRMRMHQARALQRRENAKMYAEGEPLHGTSPYDPFTLTIGVIRGRVHLCLVKALVPTEMYDLETGAKIEIDGPSGEMQLEIQPIPKIEPPKYIPPEIEAEVIPEPRQITFQRRV